MQQRQSIREHGRGFTLIELLVVIVILAVLLAIAVPTYLRQQQKARDSAAKQYLDIAYRSAEAEATSSGHSPTLLLVTSLVSAIGADQPQLELSQASSWVYAVFPNDRAIVIDSNPSTGTLGQTFVAWAKTVPPGNNLWQVIGSDQSMTFVLLGSTSAPPSNVSPPQISGSFEAGQTLTASKGTWSGLGDTCTYQWQTSTDNSTWSNISGARSASYTLQSSDVGNYVRVEVTCTNANGSATAYSSSGAGGAGGVKVSSMIPVGAVVAYAGQTPLPLGWALADGSCGYSSTANPDLYAAIGTTYGGTTSNFCLPDMRGRMALGKASSGTGSTLGQTGGQMDQSGTLNPWGTLSYAFSWNETPPNPPAVAHSHDIIDDLRTYGVNGDSDWREYQDSTDTWPTSSSNESWASQTTAVSASGSATPAAPYTISNPAYRVVRYLIAVSTAASNPPCGSLWGYGSKTAPSGAGLANGSTSASCLDAAYGGALPDLRGRFPLGQAASGTYATLNASGGSINQTASATLNTASTQASVNPGSWQGTVSEDSHTHTVTGQYGFIPSDQGPYNLWSFNQVLSTSANSNAGVKYTSGSYAPGALSTTTAGADSPSSGVFQAAYGTINWVGETGSSGQITSGTITAYAGLSAPLGWLLADGSCYSTTGADASLYSVIGYTYGGSGGSFCVPDLRGRFALGKATSGTGSTLGASGGSLAPTPTLAFSGWTPQITIPSHTFSWSIPAHTHVFAGPGQGDGEGCTNQCRAFAVIQGRNYTSTAAGGGTITSSVSSYTVNANPVSGANADPTVSPPPYLALNYIIKT